MADLAELLAATGSAFETTRADYTGDAYRTSVRGTPVGFLLDRLGEQRYRLLIDLGVVRMPNTTDILPGTLDMLILKAVSLGSLHGYGVLLRIQQISAGAFEVEQGALYPALYRLEQRGMLATEWGVSENNRRAKYYRLT